MQTFEPGSSMDVILLNWKRIEGLLVKLGVVLPPRIIDGVCNYKDGAAERLVEELYRHFTGRSVSKLTTEHKTDFTDRAYQVRTATFGPRWSPNSTRAVSS